jgi:hypothetical protein
MSDSTALIVILAVAHASLFCIYYASRTINTLGQQIVIGFIGDHAVPLRQRWLMLYNQWVSYETIYTCGSPGPAEICVKASDGDSDCDKDRCITVQCPGIVPDNIYEVRRRRAPP